jgi:hypothetical protein
MTDFIKLPGVQDERGDLRWIEGGSTIPFDIKRVFYFTDAPSTVGRGGHAHRKCHQFIVLLKGGMNVSLEHPDGTVSEILLRSGGSGFHVVPMTWCQLTVSPDTICLVLASEHYDEADYIRDYNTFREEVGLWKFLF